VKATSLTHELDVADLHRESCGTGGDHALRQKGCDVRLHLTYANVMATIAVFIALGGSSYAAVQLSRNSVRSKHIKNGQVKRGDLGRNAVDSTKVKNGALLAQDFKTGQLPTGPKGDRGAPGDAGPAGPVGSKGDSGAPGSPAATAYALVRRDGTLDPARSKGVRVARFVTNPNPADYQAPGRFCFAIEPAVSGAVASAEFFENYSGDFRVDVAVPAPPSTTGVEGYTHCPTGFTDALVVVKPDSGSPATAAEAAFYVLFY